MARRAELRGQRHSDRADVTSRILRVDSLDEEHMGARGEARIPLLWRPESIEIDRRRFFARVKAVTTVERSTSQW